jgi:hypothetical protein
VKIMLDENLSPELAVKLNRNSGRHGCTFIPFPPQDYGASDGDVPNVCRREGAVALLTADRRDFAAKDVYFRGLVDAGVSVAVLKTYAAEEFTVEAQYFRMYEFLPRLVEVLTDATEPLQISLGKTRLRRTTLQDLLQENR